MLIYEEGKRASNAKGKWVKEASQSAWFQITHDLDSVSGCGGDVPGALLTAGVLVRPVWAAQGPAGAVDLMLTLSWTRTSKNTRKHTHKEEVKIMAAQEKVKGNGKGTGRGETREPNEREKISKKHILMTSSVWISHGSTHACFKQTLLHWAYCTVQGWRPRKKSLLVVEIIHYMQYLKVKLMLMFLMWPNLGI